MDSFTENLLSRARERQRLLENFNGDKNENSHLSPKKITLSQPNLHADMQDKTPQNSKHNSEGNIPKISNQKSTARISSDFSSHKTLNIQNDDFNMEIKVSSVDNVHVEVQIQEGDGSDSGNGLRKDAKNRLHRLGKLYADGEDADISSPIHQTEARFYADSPKVDHSEHTSANAKKGLSKLADLAQSINQFEDDLTPVRRDKDDKTTSKKSRKPPAPQPPAPQPPKQISTPSKPPTKPKAPPTPEVKKDSPNQDPKFAWDKKVLDSLESQGFTRTDSSSRLIYKYGMKNEKENVLVDKKNREETKPIVNSPQKQRLNAVAEKAALFEVSPNRNAKDPALLSVSERKALFEKNKGTPLVPKAPFAMATPAKPEVPKKNPVKPVVQAPVSKELETPRGVGIATKVAALFEPKVTISQEQIEKNLQEQRRKEMDVLLNRFHKPAEIINEVITEDDEYDDDATEETAMVEEDRTKIVASAPREERRSSGNKRCSTSDSPKVAAVLNDVKRIKVSPQKAGRLYPSLTDIESTTETENETRSPTPNDNSSFENSVAESDDANTSFGRDILRAVCKNQTPQKNQNLDESASDLSDVLDDMDDYIDEALAYNERNADGPTPPKQGRKSPVEPSHSFHYKSFQSDNSEFKSPMKKPAPLQDTEQLPTHVIDGDTVLPLTHTVSFYRKQQAQASNTPVRQISRQPLITEESPEKHSEEEELIKAKIQALKNEVAKQELIISQTSQALNLCNSTLEFMGSTEQVEAERVLLVATHRRQAAMHERQRLEVEKSLRPRRKGYEQLPVQTGNLTISRIVLPLKQKYVTALAAAGGKGHHVVCLIKYADQVIPTQLVSTTASNHKNPDLELCIPGTITLKDVSSDFAITFEVYCLQAQEEILPHEIKYHIKKPNTKLLTPKKDSRLIRPVKESPAGPQVVRSPTFALMGYVVFSLSTINKRHWSLNNTPSMSPLEGTVEMSVSCEMAVSVEHRGFLTMFEDVSGFGAWHRRWCLLKGDTLSYWKYPDDEKKMVPIASINLRNSITKQVGPVSRDICARLHTFLLETERDATPHDKDSLVTVRRGAKTIIRHLLSADTKEERIEWCGKLNSALSALHL